MYAIQNRSSNIQSYRLGNCTKTIVWSLPDAAEKPIVAHGFCKLRMLVYTLCKFMDKANSASVRSMFYKYKLDRPRSVFRFF